MGRTTAVKNLMVKPAILAEARTLTDSDSGKTYFLNAAGGFTVTLPSPRGGVNFEFIVKTAPTTGEYKIYAKSGVEIIRGQVITSDINSNIGADRETGGTENVRFKRNAAKVGDSIKLVSDGTYWYVDGFSAVTDGVIFREQSQSPSASPSISPSASPSVSVSISPSTSI
jgi:hypothetical protein